MSSGTGDVSLCTTETASNGKERYSFLEFIYIFFFFAIAGWIWECSLYLIRDHVLVNRGTKYGPWVPIYGYGGILVILLLYRFRHSKLRVFFYGIIISTAFEYLTSVVLEYGLNVVYWDYSDEPFNLCGRISLVSSLAFGVFSLLGTYLFAPAAVGIARRMSPKTRRIVAIVLCCLYGLDIIACAIFGFNPASSL
ncbi:MAG: putative ABC transporter permease [Lachnospiraceae bacterium]|nr:putative ABC transporter permease [Lachnospiraceae bacterium]